MRLSVKLFKIVFSVGLVLILFICMFTKTFLLRKFINIEIDKLHTDTKVVLNYIQKDLNNLSSTNIDYAQWDDTYNYLSKRNDKFTDDNFSDTTSSMAKLKVSFIIISDKSGNILFKRNTYDEKKYLFTEALSEYINLKVYKLLSNNSTKNILGVVVYNKLPILISAQRITKSNGSGNSNGIFICARYFDKDELTSIKEDTDINTELVAYNKNIILNNDSTNINTFVKITNDNFITGYGQLNDIFAKPSLFVKVTSERKIFSNAKNTTNFYLLILIAVSILFSLSIFILIQLFVIKKIKIINSTFEDVQNSQDVFTGIILKGNDELTELGLNFNNMFNRLKKSDVSIAKIQKEYTSKLEESNFKLKNEITERLLAEDQIRHLVYYDALTELSNRKKLLEDINILVESKTEKFAVLFMDFDRFKSANDNYGHHAGDYILKTVSARLKSIIRSTDEVYRIGGDEFIIILRHLKTSSNAEIIAVEALKTINTAFNYNGNQLFVGACIGISIFPEYGIDSDTLISQADSAMYEVKRNGGNGYKMGSHQHKFDSLQ